MMFYLVNVFPFLIMGIGNAFFLVVLYLCFTHYARFEDAKPIYFTSCGFFVVLHLGRIGYVVSGGKFPPIAEMLLWPPGDLLLSVLATGTAFLLFKKKLR